MVRSALRAEYGGTEHSEYATYPKETFMPTVIIVTLVLLAAGILLLLALAHPGDAGRWDRVRRGGVPYLVVALGAITLAAAILVRAAW